VISLADFFQDISVEKLIKQLESKYSVPVYFDLLDSPTGSMVETLILSMSKMEQDDSILIKDCDNVVSLGEIKLNGNRNFISFADLRNYPKIVAHNKSFLSFGTGNELDGIVEKKITGTYINVGCIKFTSISDFLSAAASLKLGRETYVSDVIRVMLEQGFSFQGVEVAQYDDWGTLDEWRDYTNSYATIFVDIDGVLVENENPIGKSTDWESFRPLQANLNFLLKLSDSGKKQIIFTTARSSAFEPVLIKNLEKYGFKNFKILSGLQHAKRYLVNDFAQTNRFPSAVAVNLPRNSDTLSDYFPSNF
jgi:hypothetical protein